MLRDVLARARALPGVELAAVGSSSAIPLDHAHRDVNTCRSSSRAAARRDAGACGLGSVCRPTTFRLLGMTLVRGRLFTDADTETTPPWP